MGIPARQEEFQGQRGSYAMILAGGAGLIAGRSRVEALRLDWSHQDPADRLSCATALDHGLALITHDQQITRGWRDRDRVSAGSGGAQFPFC